MSNPYQVVQDFESALCEYTGAPYCVTTTSCTMAILLACRWWYEQRWETLIEASKSTDVQIYPVPTIKIPKHTYVGVPMSIIHAGFDVAFEDRNWEGFYGLSPLPVWDCARYFTSNLYAGFPGSKMVCVSFHHTKHLGISIGGGAILHDNEEADQWLRMARFDGRQAGVEPRNQKSWVMGYHAAMSPQAAAEGLLRLSTLPLHNEPLPNSDYPDLSQLEIFK